MSSAIRWGDVDNDDDRLDAKLSSSTTTSLSSSTRAGTGSNNTDAAGSTVDAKGVKTTVEYATSTSGERMKITTKTRMVKKEVRVSKSVQTRRKWKKFGDITGVPPGPEANVTYTSAEIINLDLRPKKREEEKEESNLNKLEVGASVMMCRNCGESGHWTLKCPKRLTQMPGNKMPEEEAKTGGDAAAAGASGKYVPIHLRGGAKQTDFRDETPTLRVTNISEDTTEADLTELFRRFGHTQRVYLAKDRVTNQSRGFAFVNFTRREDAQKAIEKLNGHGYDNLILHVEWAKPREPKEGGGTAEDGDTRTQDQIRAAQKRQF